MLHLEYAKIIIKGLCNSPNFLIGHLKREINKLINEGYEFDEIDYNINFVISLIKEQIEGIYEKEKIKFTQYKEIDNKLPDSKKYFYPEPKSVEEISISKIVFPNGQELNLSQLKRTFKLKDFREVEDSLKEVSSFFTEHTTIETNAEQEMTSLIESFLKEFKSEFNSEKDYLKAIAIFENYFSEVKGKIGKPIFIKSGNIKKLAYALGEIWRSKRNNVITYEYLELYRQAFTIFENQKIDRKNLMSSNLYKYSISKT